MTNETVTKTLTFEHESQASIERGPRAALDMVMEFVVDSGSTFELAGEELRSISTKKAALTERRLKITRPMDAAKQEVMDLFREPIATLEKAESTLKSKMLAYQQEQQRKAAAEREAAEKAAAEERKRLDDEARRLAEAGRSGEAEVKRAVAEMIVAPAPTTAKPVAKGISTTTSIDFEVTSLKLLLAYIVTGKVYEEGDPAIAHPELLPLILVDSVKMRAYTKGLGLATNLPGLHVYNKQTIAARKV